MSGDFKHIRSVAEIRTLAVKAKCPFRTTSSASRQVEVERRSWIRCTSEDEVSQLGQLMNARRTKQAERRGEKEQTVSDVR